MVKSLLVSASVLALGVISTQAAADPLTISTATTAPVHTANASNGSAGDITIASGGSITPTVSGPAVTIDSNNSVTNNGTISFTSVDNAVGIQAAAGVTGNITNAATITITESYTRTDTNGDGVLDGSYASGTGRFGIRTLGALTGTVNNTGSITVESNNGGGIVLGGPLTGSLSQTGTVAVLGDNSVGVGTAAVSGGVTLGGSITAYGTNSSAVVLGGNIGGALTVTAGVASSGYSSSALPATLTSLTASNLLQSGPAFWLQGSVAGGAAFLSSTSTTTNGTTTTTPASTIINYGSAPGLLIGSASNNITLGPIATDTNNFGLDVGGSVTGTGVYAGFNASGVQVGGLGGTVAIANGIRVDGQIVAASNGASAVAFEMGSGASAPTMVVSGRIAGTVTTAVTSGTPVAIGLRLDAGASLPSLTNSGTIYGGGLSGSTAYGIRDLSGTLKQITNNGTIQAVGGTSNIAIDESGTSGVTITQASVNSVTPVIAGDIHFGGGANALNASGGTITGNMSFGAGSTNSIALSGATSYSGNIDFGGNAATVTIGGTAALQGGLLNGGAAAVTLNGGTLVPAFGQTNSIGSLAMNGGTLRVTLDSASGTASLLQVAGNASFASGSKLAVQFSGVANSTGTFTVVQAGSLTGASNLVASGVNVPFIFNSSVATNGANTAVLVSISRKTATQLGLSAAQATIFDPAYAAASGDSPIGNHFLALTSAGGVQSTLQQLLPIFESGAFDTASLTSRETYHLLADTNMPVLTHGNLGVWMQLVGWKDSKSLGSTQAYKTYGSALNLGIEHRLGDLGRIGITGLYGWGVNNDTGDANGANSTDKRIGVYWRGAWGGLHAYVSGNYGQISFANTRVFNGNTSAGAFSRNADANWNSTVTSGGAGVSYQFSAGTRFYVRPAASVDYVKLKEDGYTEAGGGSGFDLVVASRTSTETGINGTLTLGYYLSPPRGDDSNYTRIELEGGERALLNSKLGPLTASYAGGSSFALTPEARSSGWMGGLRISGGSRNFSLTAEVGAEKQQDHVAGNARIALQLRL